MLEWTNRRDWKSRVPFTGDRGFESHPLRHPNPSGPLTPGRRSWFPVLQSLTVALMETDELKYWVALNRVPRIGRARFMALERHFGTWKPPGTPGRMTYRRRASTAGRRYGSSPEGLPSTPDAELDGFRVPGLGPSPGTIPDYPPRLKEIYDLPPVLYVRGELAPEDERSIAVVGTRKPTAYGREVVHRLSYDLARAGRHHRERAGTRHRLNRPSRRTGGGQQDNSRSRQRHRRHLSPRALQPGRRDSPKWGDAL